MEHQRKRILCGHLTALSCRCHLGSRWPVAPPCVTHTGLVRRACQVSGVGPLTVFLDTPAHFLWRNILDVCGHRPCVAEGVLQRPGAITVELILHWPQLLRAGGHRTLEYLVHPLDID